MKYNKNAFLLVLLAFCWGPTFLFNKIGVQEIPVLTLAWSRVGIAALILCIALRCQGERLPAWGPVWKHLIVMGLVSSSLPFTLFVWGAIYVSVSLAAILIGMTPFYTALMAHFFLPNEKMNVRKVVGLLCGIFGLLCIFFPSIRQGMTADLFGVFLLIVAVASNALGYVYVRKNLQGVPPLQATAAQLLTSAITLTPLCFIVDQPLTLPIPSLQALLAALMNAVVGTALAFLIYYKLIKNANATYAATVNYLLPVIGVSLGVVFMKDSIGWNFLAGAMFAILGILIANGAFQRQKVVCAPLSAGIKE